MAMTPANRRAVMLAALDSAAAEVGKSTVMQWCIEWEQEEQDEQEDDS